MFLSNSYLNHQKILYYLVKGKYGVNRHLWAGNSDLTSFEILCLSRLSGSFIQFQLKQSRVYAGQGLIWGFWH